MHASRLSSARIFDRTTLTRIYERHSSDLFRYAYRLLGDSDLAEDCVAETFSRFLRVVREGRVKVENVRAYLYRVSHNWITDHYRLKPLSPLSLHAGLSSDPEYNPSQQITHQMECDRVRALLLRLPTDQRQVIELRFLEDWPHEKVAAVLDKTVEATRALQYRALTALRRMLLESDEPGDDETA
jgi:RNA polymerase sigma-70 factor (ECF subfamily)